MVELLTLIIVIILIIVLSNIKMPERKHAPDGTEARRRELRRAERRARERNHDGLPWLGKAKRAKRKSDWDF